MRTVEKLILTQISTPNLNSMINCHVRNGNLECARQLFDQNAASRNVVSWNSMIAGHIKLQQMQNAQDLFDQMPARDTVSWNTLLSGLHNIKNTRGVFRCFQQMRRDGLRPNEFTFSVVLSAVLRTAFNVLIPQFHGLSWRFSLNSSVFVGSALIRGYTDLRDLKGFCQVFEEISVRDVTSWNALISGYMDFGLTAEALEAFDSIPRKNIISWTALVKGYINNKKLDEARSLFDKMSERNVVTWTAMISGYVQSAKFSDALQVFLCMLKSGTRPNHFTISSVLDACAGCSSLLVGMQVHSIILKSGMPLDVILSTSLVDMYAKCGDVGVAFCIFESMPEKNLVSWNSIIGGYARNGLATRALQELKRMINDGVRPDEITFVNVLSACAHGGLVQEGEMHFNSMETKYGIQAGKEHYACMVDLYGRAGELEKAEKLIEGMPFDPDVFVWGALLGACSLHSSVKLGEFAAEGIYKLEKDHPAVYSLMSKIYGEKGVWDSVIDLRSMAKKRSVKKQKAGSRIESTFGV